MVEPKVADELRQVSITTSSNMAIALTGKRAKRLYTVYHENTSLDANEISHWHPMIYSIGSIGDHVFHWQNCVFKNIPWTANKIVIIPLANHIAKIIPLAYPLYFRGHFNFFIVGTSQS